MLIGIVLLIIGLASAVGFTVLGDVSYETEVLSNMEAESVPEYPKIVSPNSRITDFNSETGEHTMEIHTTDRWAQDVSGEWTDRVNLFNITRQGDQLSFIYDGIEGEKRLTLEAGAIYNGNYYSLAEAKALMPQITFDYSWKRNDGEYKYDLNVCGLEGIAGNIDALAFTYESHYGFDLANVSWDNSIIKAGFFALNFNDLLEEGFALDLNKQEKRIYITNLASKYDAGTGCFYLDPAVTPDASYDMTAWYDSEPAGIWKFRSATETTLLWGINVTTGDIMRSAIDFDISAIMDGSTITDVDFKVYVHTIVPLSRRSTYMYLTEMTDEAADWVAAGNAANFAADIAGNTKYVTLAPASWPIEAAWWDRDLGPNADLDLQNNLDVGWFSLGTYNAEDGSASAFNQWRSMEYAGSEPYLEVSYIEPSDCVPPVSGDWVIDDGSICIKMNEAKIEIDGDFNLYDGRLMLSNTDFDIIGANKRIIIYALHGAVFDLNNGSEVKIGA